MITLFLNFFAFYFYLTNKQTTLNNPEHSKPYFKIVLLSSVFWLKIVKFLDIFHAKLRIFDVMLSVMGGKTTDFLYNFLTNMALEEIIGHVLILVKTRMIMELIRQFLRETCFTLFAEFLDFFGALI